MGFIEPGWNVKQTSKNNDGQTGKNLRDAHENKKFLLRLDHRGCSLCFHGLLVRYPDNLFDFLCHPSGRVPLEQGRSGWSSSCSAHYIHHYGPYYRRVDRPLWPPPGHRTGNHNTFAGTFSLFLYTDTETFLFFLRHHSRSRAYFHRHRFLFGNTVPLV